QVEDALGLALRGLPVRAHDGRVDLARLELEPCIVGGERAVHLEVQVLARGPRAHDVERRDKAEGPAVEVVRRRPHLVVDGVARDADTLERLAHDGVEHLRRHAVLVARDDGKLGEADDGDVAKAHRRWLNDSNGASGSPVGRKYMMSSWSPRRSPSGFQTASTRMPMRTSAGGHSWISANIEMSAPSSATDAAT